ncbi:MAG: CDP-alcohol phosphatidyltransferase family protein [Vicinamibacteria bacterium]
MSSGALLTAGLRKEWALSTVCGIAVLSASTLFQPSSLSASLLVWAWCSWHLYRALPENRRNEETTLFATLGSPTHLTMVRGLLISVAAGFLLEPAVSAPAYSLAALLDHTDGRLARCQKRETRLGSRLDMEIDAVGVLVASLAGIGMGKLPPWYLAIGLARYLFVLGIEWRRRFGESSVRELDPSRLRRLLAGFQMGFLAVMLWPPIPAAVSRNAAYAFGGATLLMFARDWLIVSSRKRSIFAIESSHRG